MTDNPLVERVDRDPTLSGSEKETVISMYGDDKRFSIYSAKPTIVKSLLKHDFFEMDWARMIKNEKSIEVKNMDELESGEGNIVAIEGTLPIGTLTIKSKPRANNHQSSIVSTEGIDPSVFGRDED